MRKYIFLLFQFFSVSHSVFSALPVDFVIEFLIIDIAVACYVFSSGVLFDIVLLLLFCSHQTFDWFSISVCIFPFVCSHFLPLIPMFVPTSFHYSSSMCNFTFQHIEFSSFSASTYNVNSMLFLSILILCSYLFRRFFYSIRHPSNPFTSIVNR